MTSCSLATQHCGPCEGGVPPLDDASTAALLTQLPGWARTGMAIEKRYDFTNHHEAMAFTNAVAWVSHRENHHPEIILGYRTVAIRYWTHAIGGLSENDFICAAKIEKLFEI